MAHHFRLPGNPELAWSRGEPDSTELLLERKGIGTILTHDDDLQIIALGNAFVAYAAGNAALCICAAHSLEALRNLDRTQIPRFPHLPPNDGELVDPEFLSPDRLKVIFESPDGKDFVDCRLVDLHFQADNDLALLVVHDTAERGFFGLQMPLNLDVPRVGDVVMMVGHRLSVDHAEREESGPQVGEAAILSQSLEARRGLVTDVQFERSGKGQSFVIHTTFPSLPGMSGSPVFLDLKKGDQMSPIGLLSADLSDDRAENDQRIAGRSTVSMLWPIAGLGMMMTWESEEAPRLTVLADLLAREKVPNASRRSELDCNLSRSRTVLRFFDPAHGRCELETPGHPLASDQGVAVHIHPSRASVGPAKFSCRH
ncbi:MAG: trypsin-like peptidase domain-containing protein [Devosia sp.]